MTSDPLVNLALLDSVVEMEQPFLAAFPCPCRRCYLSSAGNTSGGFQSLVGDSSLLLVEIGINHQVLTPHNNKLKGLFMLHVLIKGRHSMKTWKVSQSVGFYRGIFYLFN